MLPDIWGNQASSLQQQLSTVTLFFMIPGTTEFFNVSREAVEFIILPILDYYIE